MAVTANTIFRIRPSGLETNSGGFDPTVTGPGTDYSQQNSPLITCTDLVIGSTNTQCSSAQIGFTSAHVGNTLNVTSGTGFTVQRVVIISVSGGVATCNTALGTANSTAGSATLGGGMTLPNQNYSSTQPKISTAVQPGNTVYILGANPYLKGSYPTSGFDYTFTGRWTPNGGNASVGYVKWINEPGTMPRIKSDDVLLYIPGTYSWFEGLYLISTGSNVLFSITSTVVQYCVININNLSVASINSMSGCTIRGNDIYGGSLAPTASAGSVGLSTTTYSNLIESNFIHHFRDVGVLLNGPADVVIKNLIYGCKGDSIKWSGIARTDMTVTIDDNTIDAGSGHGINISNAGGGSNNPIVLDIGWNIISNHSTAGKYAIAFADGTTAANDARKRINYNCYYGNAANLQNASAGLNDLVNVDPQYASVATFDWTPGNTALKLSRPFLGSAENQYRWVGAVQPQSSGSSVSYYAY